MATRQEVHHQRSALMQELREGCRSGRLRAGELAPAQRELAARYSLSKNVVYQALQSLVDEGYFHTVPRVGTFVGQSPNTADDIYLLLLPDNIGLIRKVNLELTRQGFEERVSERGNVSLAMPLGQAVELRERHELPRLAGIYDLAYHVTDATTWGIDRTLARVGFSGRIEDPDYSDVVSYDDRDGGRQATRHLLALGHRRIGFLALHAAEEAGEDSEMVWSRHREAGWQEAMTEAGLDYAGLAFYPVSNINRHELIGQVEAPARKLLSHTDITAVVASNDDAALCLQALARARSGQTTGSGASRMPAIVGFDNVADATHHSLSSLRLPAEQIGHAAADLLWARRNGSLEGPPQHRRVPMRLISRLSSFQEQHFAPCGAEIHASHLSPHLTLV